MTRWQFLTEWLRTFEADVRAGRVTITEVLDLADEDINGTTICPLCGKHAQRTCSGTCRVCAIERMKRATDEKLLELEAHKAAVTSRQHLRRLRIELGDDVPDHLRARGHSSRELRGCPACGATFYITRHASPDTTCPECRDLAARRAAEREEAKHD